MKRTETIDFLKNNSVFWSKLGFYYDPPRFDKDGKMIVFGDDFERFGKYHRDFAAAGVNIHTSILFSGWVGINKYDYELTDQVLDAVFKDNPDICYIPRIKLNVPLDWGKENPEDICVYYEGPRDKEEIRRLVNTGKQDILGYDAPDGYYTAGVWNDDRPNVGGVISNQSFSSPKWLSDAGEALRRLIAHLEQGPYGDRIIAYHIAYGACGETCLWGRGSGKIADYGITNRREFFDWGLRRYGSLEKLREVWNKPDLERENAEPPPPGRRLATGSLREFFRADERICVDYDIFMSEMNAAAIEHFGKIVKDLTGKFAGCFYGYLAVSNAAYSGWLAYERLLNSPYVDFFAAPKAYYRSALGEPGGELAPAQSINRRKLWMDELDNHTYLCTTDTKECDNFDDTRTVMWREFSKNISHGSSFWWMDLGGGWYDSPELLREVALIEKTIADLRTQPAKSIAEILLVTDEESMYYHSCSRQLNLAMTDIVRNTNLCGAPSDMYRLSDLKSLDLEQYKLIIFLETFKLNLKSWKQIKTRIPEHATLLWNYAPGIRNPEFALENIKSITGFEVKEKAACSPMELLPESESLLAGSSSLKPEIPENSTGYPLLEIVAEAGTQVLARYNDGACAVASKLCGRHNVIYSVLPFFSPDHLRRIAVAAGCHMYAPVDCTVYGDSRFIAVFPRSSINSQLHLKKLADFIDAGNGECFKQTNIIPLKLDAKRHKFFVKIVKHQKN